MMAEHWSAGRDLPEGARILLEASAGTGKTYAIEGIVARLVAEHGVPIDRILVITFTNAATAELRDRVRRRLVRARDALETGVAGDELLAHLCAPESERGARRQRVQRALTDFDRAPISTIHGFCQRTLQQLAFESGQEPELDVLGDAAEVRDELVADALAAVYARATEHEVALLHQMGYDRATLAAVAKEMTGPVEPRLTPAADPDHPADDPLHVARELWPGEVGALRGWLAGEGAPALAAFAGEAGRPSKSQARGRPHKRITRMPEDVGEWLAGWLEAGAPLSGRDDSRAKWATSAWLSERWTGDGPFEGFEGYPVVARVDALLATQDRVWRAALAGFAHGVRPRFEAEIRRRAQLTYDGMLSRLAEGLRAEPPGGPLARAIGDRYEVALVDEFQDTDAAQWTVLERVFLRDDRRLFVIGDPKQSIYAFRNADLHVYQRAAGHATRYHLATNHRSDGALVAANDRLWGSHPRPFGEAGIGWTHVDAHAGTRVRGLPDVGGRPRRPLELRWFDGASLHRDPDDGLNKEESTALCVRACAAECRALLESGAEVVRGGAPGEERWGALRPGDIAVLVGTNRESRAVRTALAAQGIPAVTGGRGSIFESEAVSWLCAWLDALAAPASEGPARTLAVTPLAGFTAGRLLRALAAPRDPGASGGGDPHREDRVAWEQLRASVTRWAEAWPRHGFARVFEAALDAWASVPRLLGSVHGERGATDLRHLAELCHVEERRTRVGPRGLAEWLRQRAEQADDGDEQAIRLESDANAVQIVTIHKSKGLQYGITLLPFGWVARGGPGKGPLRVCLPDGDGLVLDLSMPGTPEREAAEEAARREAADERMRVLYVAMTRARHHVVAWLGAYDQKEEGALTRLVTGRLGGGEGLRARARAALDAICDGDGTVGWADQPPVPRPGAREPWRPDGGAEPALAVHPFPADRAPGALWQVASYSSLAKGRAVDLDDPSGRTPELAATEDEAPPAAVTAAGDADDPRGSVAADLAWAVGARDASPAALAAALAARGLLEPAAGAALPGGTTTGDWLHEVLEHLDFGGPPGSPGAAKDGVAAADLVARLGRRHATPDPLAHDEALRLLPGWLDTPLDAPLPPGAPDGALRGLTLRSLLRSDRLDELGFDLCLGAGVTWTASMRSGPGDLTGRVDPRSVRVALEDALGDHPQARFGARPWVEALLALEGPRPGEPRRLLPAIAGLLTGFVDLVLRTGGAGADAVYFVADYKTNALRGPASLRTRVADVLAAAGHEETRGLPPIPHERPAAAADPRAAAGRGAPPRADRGLGNASARTETSRPESAGASTPSPGTRVGDRGLRRLHYTRPVLAWEMGHAAYHLQALVYTVALHRLLGQRLGDAYRYDRHVGGHLYLFLKGMEGRDTPRVDGAPLGVWADRWPRRTVVGLDRALLGDPPDRVRAAMDAGGDA